jgi:hypothetical protein
MVLGEVLAAEFVWVSCPSGTVPQRARVIGPKGGEPTLGSEVAVLLPFGAVRDVLPQDCFPTRREAVRDALARTRRMVGIHEDLLRRARQEETRLLALMREPEPTEATEPAGAQP